MVNRAAFLKAAIYRSRDEAWVAEIHDAARLKRIEVDADRFFGRAQNARQNVLAQGQIRASLPVKEL